jgi:hypothetical protein
MTFDALDETQKAMIRVFVDETYRWTCSPFDTFEQREMAISKVACIVCDTASGWLKVAPEGPNPMIAESVIYLHHYTHEAKQNWVVSK